MDGIPNLDTYCHIGSQRLHSILKNTAQTCIACKGLQQKKGGNYFQNVLQLSLVFFKCTLVLFPQEGNALFIELYA